MEQGTRFTIDYMLNTSEDPAIAALPNGGFVVAYNRNSQSDGDGIDDILVAFFDAEGNAVGAPIQVSSLAINDPEDNPRVAVMADGNIVVVWTREVFVRTEQVFDGDVLLYEYDVYRNENVARIIDAQGNFVSPEFIIGSGSGTDDPTELIALANGGFALAWNHEELYDPYDTVQEPGGLRFQSFDGSGVASTGVVEISLGDGWSRTAEMVELPDGRIAVSYGINTYNDTEFYTEYALYLQVFDFDGTLGAPGLLERGNLDAVDYQIDQDIVLLNDGTLVTVWLSSNGNATFLIRDPVTGTFTPRPFAATAPIDTKPSVVATTDGGFVMAWMGESQPGLYSVYAQRYDASGVAQGDLILLGTGEVDAETVQLSALAGNGFVVAWESEENDVEFIQGYYFGPDGVITGDQIFTFEDDTVDFTQLTQLQTENLDILVELDRRDVAYRALDGNDTVRLAANGTALVEGFEWDGSILFEAGNGDDTVTGAISADLVSGGSGTDTVRGGGGDDVLYGDEGDDQLYGDAGWDTLHGGAGNDLLDGGNGSDFASYATASAAVQVDLSITVAQDTGGAGIDTLTRMENLIGSDFGDILTGDAGVNRIRGGLGEDRIFGQAGSDLLFGEGGSDIIYGGTGNDVIYGEYGWDIIFGEDGSDTAYGGNGNDLLLGQLGNDTLFGENGADRLSGGVGDDILDGGAGNDRLDGGSQNDQLFGGDGNDVLIGEYASDRLTGGAGADVFSFDDGHASRYMTNTDVITDFNQAEGDIIDLSAIDAIAGGDDDSFTFIGRGAFSGTAGELKFFVENGNTFIAGDIDGDGVADVVVQLEGVYDLTSVDFGL